MDVIGPNQKNTSFFKRTFKKQQNPPNIPLYFFLKNLLWSKRWRGTFARLCQFKPGNRTIMIPRERNVFVCQLPTP